MTARARLTLARTAGAFLVVVGGLSFLPKSAHATYSVALADRASGVVAVGVASCVPLDVVQKVAGLVRGKGAFVTQSYLYAPAHDEAARRMALGEAAEVILPKLLDPKFDAELELRQYALVTLQGGVASHTGSRTLAYAGHASSTNEGTFVVFQGNVLAGRETLDAMVEAFASSPGTSLDKLTASFVAPSMRAPVRGDARCTTQGRSALAATLDVLARDPKDDLHLAVEAAGSEEPLRAIAEGYAAYVRARPAPSEPPPMPSAPTAVDAPAAPGGCASTRLVASEDMAFVMVGLALGVCRRRGRERGAGLAGRPSRDERGTNEVATGSLSARPPEWAGKV